MRLSLIFPLALVAMLPTLPSLISTHPATASQGAGIALRPNPALSPNPAFEKLLSLVDALGNYADALGDPDSVKPDPVTREKKSALGWLDVIFQQRRDFPTDLSAAQQSLKQRLHELTLKLFRVGSEGPIPAVWHIRIDNCKEELRELKSEIEGEIVKEGKGALK